MAPGLKIGCRFILQAQKVVLGTISDNMTQKTITLRPFWRFLGQTPLRNSVAMATPKIPGDQKLFERVCYMSKLKVRTFQLPGPNSF